MDTRIEYEKIILLILILPAIICAKERKHEYEGEQLSRKEFIKTLCNNPFSSVEIFEPIRIDNRIRG